MLQQAIEREAILRYVPGTKPRRPANSPVSTKRNLGKVARNDTRPCKLRRLRVGSPTLYAEIAVIT
jgi:hypothetical protein